MNRYEFRPALYLVFVILAMLICNRPLFAQEIEITCDTERLNNGLRLYQLGLFDEVTGALEPCLPKEFSEREEQINAHRLVILSHLENQNEYNARARITDLFSVNKRYVAPLDDPLVFRLLLNDLRPPKWHQRWLWRGVVGSSVVGGVVTALVLSNDPGPDDLPAAPVLP